MPVLRGLRRFRRPSHPRLTPEIVVDCLTPVLSAERRRRIERVLGSRLGGITVVLEHLHDPHNGAAVIRTCEALGLVHVHVVEGDGFFFCSRKVSHAANKWIAIYVHPTIDACMAFLQQSGFTCWAAVPPPLEARSRRAVQLGLQPAGPLALVFGNERYGLSARALALCEQRFSIPLHGFSESLNLSVSVAMALQHVVSSRRARLGQSGDLGPRALAQLRAMYYARSTPHALSLLLHRLAIKRTIE